MYCCFKWLIFIFLLIKKCIGQGDDYLNNTINVTDSSLCDLCLKDEEAHLEYEIFCGNTFQEKCVKKWWIDQNKNDSMSIEFLHKMHKSMKVIGQVALHRATNLKIMNEMMPMKNSEIHEELRQILMDMYSTMWINHKMNDSMHEEFVDSFQWFVSTMETCGIFIQQMYDAMLVEHIKKTIDDWNNVIKELQLFLKDNDVEGLKDGLSAANFLQKEISFACTAKYHVQYQQPGESLVLKIQINHQEMESICLIAKRHFLFHAKTLIYAYQYLQNHFPQQLNNKKIDLDHLFDFSGMIDEHTYKKALTEIQIPRESNTLKKMLSH